MRIGDTEVLRCTAPEVVETVADRLSGPASAQLAVGSVNLDHLHHFRAGRAGLEGGPDWLWLADGAPVAWRGRRLTGEVWPRLTGADLLEPLLQVAIEQGAQIGFLGGLATTHALLAKVLSGRYPDAAPARFWSPSRAEIESFGASTDLAGQIRDAGVRMLVVGLGKPRQEYWIAQHGLATGAEVLLAFGAAADFLAGVVDRAPEFYQGYGLEWLYRLRQEPRRLARRYLVQGPAAVLRLRQAVLEGPAVRPASSTRPGGLS